MWRGGSCFCAPGGVEGCAASGPLILCRTNGEDNYFITQQPQHDSHDEEDGGEKVIVNDELIQSMDNDEFWAANLQIPMGGITLEQHANGVPIKNKKQHFGVNLEEKTV